MNNTITVVYENGILRPLVPLALPEHARVQIRVEQVAMPAAAGEHHPMDAVAQTDPITAERLWQERQETLTSLSEIVRQSLGLSQEEWDRSHRNLLSAAEIGREIGSLLAPVVKLSSEIITMREE